MTDLSNKAALTHINTINQSGMSDVIRELDQRTNDGITITLLWNAETNRVFVSIVEERHDVSFEFAVAAADAADAFHHPHAYAAVDQEDHAFAA